MTEFLHEMVKKRELDMSDPWAVHSQATERLVQWLIDQQREEDNANV